MLLAIRACVDCGIEYPVTSEFFNRIASPLGLIENTNSKYKTRKGNDFYFERICIDCSNEYEVIKKQEWRARNPERSKQLTSKSVKKWIINNKEKWNEQQKRYFKKYSKSPQYKKFISKYYKKRMKEDINFKLSHNLRNRVRTMLKKNKGKRAGSAVRDLGCSIEEFKKYIESKFQDGMTWGNYGKWHLDHVKPLASFDLTNRTQFLEACNYMNYQPLWALDNIKKSDKIT
jgi:hypothetical protein